MQGNGALRLTTARYYTPAGRSIQAKGIQPDINVEQARIESIENGANRSEADLRNHLDNDDGEDANAGDGDGSAAAIEDFQLARALDLLRGISFFNRQATN